MTGVPVTISTHREEALARRVRWLVTATISYNVVEAVVALAAGAIASSIALLGFGLDSVVEVTSAAAVAWQFAARDHGRRQARERTAQVVDDSNRCDPTHRAGNPASPCGSNAFRSNATAVSRSRLPGTFFDQILFDHVSSPWRSPLGTRRTMRQTDDSITPDFIPGRMVANRNDHVLVKTSRTKLPSERKKCPQPWEKS